MDDSPTDSPNTASSGKNAVLFVLSMTAILGPMIGSAIGVALPAIEAEFHIDAVKLSWIATATLLGTSIMLIPAGRWADIHGRKRVFNAGLWVITLSSFFAGMAPSADFLILCRFFQGAGAALFYTTGQAILSSVFPPQERGKALGVYVAAVYAGLSIGPFIGGLLTEHLGWRSVLYVNAPVGLLLIFLTHRQLKGEWAEAKGEEYDRIGAAIYAVFVAALTCSVSFLPGPLGVVLLSIGIFGLCIFVFWELRVDAPVFEIRILKTNRMFAFSNLSALIHYSSNFAVLFLLSLYLQHIKGLSPQTTGIVMVVQPIMMTVFSPIAGRMSDRFEPRFVATAGMIITAISLFLFVFLDTKTSLAFVIIAQLLLGIGFGVFSSPNTNAVMSSVEKRFYGLAAGTIATMRVWGMLISMAVLTLVFNLQLGRVKIAPENHPELIASIQILFAVYAGMCFIGAFTSFTRGDLRSN